MICLTILYPETGEAKFGLDYYLNVHIPLVREKLQPEGLISIDLEQGLAGGLPGTPPIYAAIGKLNFETPEALQSALAIHGPELMADIPNFTKSQPLMQLSRII
ncbi:EthD family reductase [Dyadobacter sp. CY323]|uniref:EthD family reductase n=1 Tax=Dyadobacter sp. CY323 TaxID=2907302 RepID=UPI001F19A544|nr:EthD family reductase [Dyadobacter sp. CY323]MCE6992521.1 EthD family reductase [Dyadobacter sp. CY323]